MPRFLKPAAAACTLLALLLSANAPAQTSAKPAKAKPAAKATRPAAKAPAKKPVAPPPLVLDKAPSEQIAAAALAYYGDYACEFDQKLAVAATPLHEGYVDVSFNKKTWTMKPVLSSTGALRLEDVRGQMLMLQIANKSMLMDSKIGQRIVDACVHEKQLQAIAAAALQPPGEALLQSPQAAAAAASAAAGAASAAAGAASAAAGAASAAASAADAAASAAGSAASAAAAAASAVMPAASAPMPAASVPAN